MKTAADTSVLIASLDANEPAHAACNRIIAGGVDVSTHALAELFAIMTGGGAHRKLRASMVVELVEQQIVPHARIQALGARDYLTALAECEARGARGGAVYDLLHLIAARKAGAERFVTLDERDFKALARTGDPLIELP